MLAGWFEVIAKELEKLSEFFLGRTTVQRISYLLSRIVQFQPDLIHDPLQFFGAALFAKLPCNLLRAFAWLFLKK